MNLPPIPLQRVNGKLHVALPFTTYTMPVAGLVVTIAFTSLGIFDLWKVLITGTGSSISNFLINAGVRDPVIVGAAMFLMGHLWGGMHPAQKSSQ